MSITIINYVSTSFLFATAAFIFLKNRRSINAVLIALFCIAAAISSFFIGLSFDFGNAGKFAITMWLLRLAAISILMTYIVSFRISLTFPYEKKLKTWTIFLILLWIGMSLVILFSPKYITSVTLKNGLMFRHEGSHYSLYTFGSVFILLVGIVVLAIRRRSFDNAIHKLQSLLVLIGTGVAIFIGFFFTIVIPKYFEIFSLYPLSGLVGFLAAGMFFYSIITYRMFDISTAIHKTMLFLAISSTIGVVAGFTLSGAAHYAVQIPLVLSIPGFMLIFILLIFFRDKLQKQLTAIFRRKSEYQDDLLNRLKAIDFSKGLDEVVDKFVGGMRENIGTQKISLISENSIGQLYTLYPDKQEEVGFEKSESFIEFLINENLNVILKSEVFTNPVLQPVKVELLALFMQLNAEAVIIFREGTSIFGILTLGQKDSLKEYDSYDYQALKALMPQMFVIMYFIRNIERQSVAVTVEKELKFSEQIISSLMENVDVIDANKLSCNFINKSSSGLGGDFVDIIRLGKNKTMFVLGDIAGHGLNASMSMVILKSVIRTFLKEGGDFKSLVVKVNNFIKSHLPRGTFFAGIFFIIDTAANQLYYINCGVPLFSLYSSNYRSVIEIQGEGKVLGFVKNIAPLVKVKKTELNQNDILFLTTDGILESESIEGIRFDREVIASLLIENHNKSPELIIKNIYNIFLDFVANEIRDDITLVAIKII